MLNIKIFSTIIDFEVTFGLQTYDQNLKIEELISTSNNPINWVFGKAKF